MILNCMLGSGYGGLEKLFLDEIEMLPPAGFPARGVVRRNSELAGYAKGRAVAFDEITTWSDWDPISIARVRAVIRRQSPELVMCVGRKAHRLFGRAIGSRIPIVPMVQKRRFDRDFPYAGVFVAAEHRRRTLVEDGVVPENIAVIPNAVRLPEPKSDYGLVPGKPVGIVAHGRLHQKKGYEILVEAIALLFRNGFDCTCKIAGDGPEREKLQALIEGENLNDKIALTGWTDSVADFLAPGDIFVLPSFQEDFPLAVLDAMASGMPIVASAIDGPKDFLVEGETALLVPPGDPAALAQAVERLIADDELRETLGRAARAEAVAKYSFEAVGKQLAQALRNVLAGRPISTSL
ncbi:MAG TPA: glycosyltransferase family 4 protein [Rhizomicrobium sp.]|jgi:glycosyltransferase involved in cell wall biosynthesis|nr:glycosyltransferase family 4 protein [Rhizomicrobium sp.]